MRRPGEIKTVERDRIGWILFIIYWFLLIASLVVVGRIIQIQLFFKPGEKIMFCTDPWKREGEDKWLPSKGTTRTYEEMLHSLEKNTSDGFEEAVFQVDAV